MNAKALVILALAHVPMLVVICWLLGRPIWGIAVAALAFAAVPALLLWLRRPCAISARAGRLRW